MREGAQASRPAVSVAAVNEAVRRELLAGVEEEGVLPNVESVHGPCDVVATAGLLAGTSTLAVAVVGDEDDHICVHHAQAPADQPIFRSSGPVDLRQARIYGHNAARLVVGIPLIDIHSTQEDASPSEGNRHDSDHP